MVFAPTLAKLIIAFVLLLIAIQPSYATTVDKIPQPSDIEQNYIIDLGNVLDREIETQINNKIAILQKNKHKTIYIVTVPVISETPTPKKFKIVPEISSSRRFLESILLNWNIKELQQGNGILIFVSIEDRSIEIRSGFNLKYIIQDRHIQGIIDKIIIPELQQRNFNQGVLLGTTAIIKKIDNPYYNSLPDPKSTPWQTKQILE